MTQQISFQAGVTLVGAAPFDAQDLHAALALAPHPVAADGGADALMTFGTAPEVVIGDMDSLQGTLPPPTMTMPVTEQETTDFGKCLAHVVAPFCIGVGFLGGRLDHTLATLSILLEHADKRVVLLGAEDVAFVAPPCWTIAVSPGTRVSFFPLLPCRGGASRGLHWPIEGLEMRAGGQIGTSNEAVDTEVSAGFEPAGAITMLPKHCLGAVLDSLGAA